MSALDAIDRYKSKGQEEFPDNELVQVWMIQHLQVIGEAASRVTVSVQEKAPETPWQEIAGMRNLLIHAYFSVDPEIIWTTIEKDLPSLRAAVERLLPDFK